MAHYVIFTNFFKVTWPKNVPAYVKTEGTWQKRNYIRNVLQATRSLCHFRFKSYGHYLIFTKVVTLTLPFVRLSKKKVLHCRVSRRHLLQKKSRTIGQAVRPVEPLKTDKQTNRQTRRQADRQTAVTNILSENRRFRKVTNRQTDRQTAVTNILFENRRFRKVIKAAIIEYFSNYIDFNWPWPLTLTFDLWTWPFIYFVRKNVMLWRNVRQNGASHIRMEITPR